VFAYINSGTQQGVMRTKSGKTMGKASMRVGMGTNYAQSSNYFTWIRNREFDYNVGGLNHTASMLSSNLYMSLGLLSWWDMGVQLPLYWDGVLEEDGGPSEFGMGDLEISSKMLYPPPSDQRLFYQSYLVGIAADLTGMQGGFYPRHAYYNHKSGDDASDVFNAERFVIKGGLLWTLDFRAPCCTTPLVWHVNGIVNIPTNGDREITGTINSALEYVPAEVFTFFVEYASEIRASTVIDDITTIRNEPMWVTPGVRIKAPSGFFVKVGADIGVSSPNERFHWTDGGNEYRTDVVPDWGVQFAFGWKGFLTAQDADGDGIKDDVDRCPKDKEDVDGFEDADGCPDKDNDSDGIPDAQDQCPDEAEDDDGHNDSDGCPDQDNDEDGISDMEDKCPKDAEDFDGFEDEDGCPDEDNDKDGVPDSVDKCINEAEDFDRFEDEDGCPDLDNDQDGIKDIEDKCPNKPETFNNYQDEDGCPDEKKPEKKKECDFPQHKVMRGVNFQSGHSEMTFDSYKYLNPIVKKLKECPDVEIEVQGHTDSMGKLSTNMRLSRMRAQSVKQYLVSQGIDPDRIQVQGYGPKRPIADNRTASGRRENRRIEIKRIK
jgi:outer membrane protein OmpA-like peptidoglycan-associated protein